VKAHFVSLGCAKNLVDTEVMIAKLGAAGYELVGDAQDADTVVINTCAFIDPAKAESTEVILEHAQRKRRGQQLVVAGCLAQRYGEQLQSLVPEIDGVIGTAPNSPRFRGRARARFSSAPGDHAARDGISQGRRGLRSSVHLLYHSETAWQFSEPKRGVDPR